MGGEIGYLVKSKGKCVGYKSYLAQVLKTKATNREDPFLFWLSPSPFLSLLEQLSRKAIRWGQQPGQSKVDTHTVALGRGGGPEAGRWRGLPWGMHRSRGSVEGESICRQGRGRASKPMWGEIQWRPGG